MENKLKKLPNEYPIVSVIIPVFNGEKYIERSINSVLSQSYNHIQVICVDDGSFDNSSELLRSYGNKIEHVHQQNKGVAYARAHGLKIAKGEFIAFLDQDDWWEPLKIEEQVKRLTSNKDIGLVHTAVKTFDQDSNAFVDNITAHATPQNLVGHCFGLLVKENHIYNSSVMVRASLIEEVGGFDFNIKGNSCQDYDLWLRIAKLCEFDFIDIPLTTFRIHSEQGHKNRVNMLTEERYVLEKNANSEAVGETVAYKKRVASIDYWLGVAYLDDNKKQIARKFFKASFQKTWTHKAFAAYIVAFMPDVVISMFRNMPSQP